MAFSDTVAAAAIQNCTRERLAGRQTEQQKKKEINSGLDIKIKIKK